MKKILCLAICFSLLMATFSVIASANEGVRPNTENETASDIKEAVAGDINGDEIVDIIDVALGRAYIIGNVELTADQLKAGKALNPTDDVFDIIDIVSMRAYIVNGNLNPIEPPETDTETDSDTDTPINPTKPMTADEANKLYGFLDVSEARIEKAYRALIEHNAKGTTPTEEDIRIVKEDCVRYVLTTDNTIYKTWIYTSELNCDNGGYYVGVGGADIALKAWSAKENDWVWVYNYDKSYYNSAYDMFRNECHNLAEGFIECSKADHQTYERYRFNFDINYQTYTYVVNFVYG